MSLAVLTAVAAGAAIGVLARHGLTLVLPAPAPGFPWATLVVNLSGSLMVGVVTARLNGTGGARWHRPFAVTGVLGSFTTYSTFAVETDILLRQRPALAAVYVAVTIGGGVLAAMVGGRSTRT